MDVTMSDLQQTGLFRDDGPHKLEPHVLSLIHNSSNTVVETLPKSKDAIFKQQHKQTDYFYILLKGVVHLARADHEGTLRHMAFRVPGEQFGMTPAIAQAPHEGNTYALTELNVLRIGTDDFMCAMQLSRLLMRRAIRSVSNRFLSYAFLRDTLHSGIRGGEEWQESVNEENRRRFAGFIAEFYRCAEINKRVGLDINEINIPIENIASLIDVPRSSLRPIIKEFQEANFIDRVGSQNRTKSASTVETIQTIDAATPNQGRRGDLISITKDTAKMIEQYFGPTIEYLERGI